MLKKIVCIITIIFGFIVSESVFAAKQKIGPPYPEVWGYDLSSLPAMKHGSAGMMAYAMDDGDIWFLVTKNYKLDDSLDTVESRGDFKYLLIKFFKGEKKELSEKELDSFFKLTQGKEVASGYMYNEKFAFSDGSSLKFYPIRTASKIYIPEFYGTFFIKTDKNGLEKKFSILGASLQVEMFMNNRYPEASTGPFLYEKLYALQHIISLKDDTFIVFKNGGNLILRFNKDLETKFKPINPIRIQGTSIPRNFFVIDYSVIDQIKKQYPGEPVPYYQYVHDHLLSHFYKEYNK